MATLAFAAVGSALGSALLPAGFSVLGTTLTGAAIGAQIGAIGGGFVDQILLGGNTGRSYEGPRLTELRITGSTEGAPVPRVFGRARIGGQVIWAAEIEEQVNVEQTGGGKGGFGGGTNTTTYSYFASFAVGLSEGEIAGLGRIWADNEELRQRDAEPGPLDRRPRGQRRHARVSRSRLHRLRAPADHALRQSNSTTVVRDCTIGRRPRRRRSQRRGYPRFRRVRLRDDADHA
jgi:hypothetical protein